MEARLTKESATAMKDMESQIASARLQAETDRERHQHVLADMRKRCDDDIKVSQAQAKAARDEAKKALEFDRRRAENTVKNSVAAEREEKERLIEELEDVKDKLSREYQSKLRHLEIKVKSAEDQKRIGEGGEYVGGRRSPLSLTLTPTRPFAAVDKAVEKLKRVHASELSAAVREAAMRAGQAASKQTGAIHQGSTAAASKARVERRDSRVAGGGAEVLKKEEEADMAHMTAEEINKGKEVDTVVLTGEGSGAGLANAARLSEANSTINLLNIKLKHHAGENQWLRSRVNDLEVMVKTMKVAMEGSLEDGAAEKEFGGWRQVISVQYPWLRDRKREDPARYTYLDPKQTFLKGIGGTSGVTMY